MSSQIVVVPDLAEISALCRLCMKYSEYYINIFIPNKEFEVNFEKTIHDLLTLKVALGDGLPCTVCLQCVGKLKEFRDFKDLCLSSDEELKKSLASLHVKDEIDLVSSSCDEREDLVDDSFLGTSSEPPEPPAAKKLIVEAKPEESAKLVYAEEKIVGCDSLHDVKGTEAFTRIITPTGNTLEDGVKTDGAPRRRRRSLNPEKERVTKDKVHTDHSYSFVCKVSSARRKLTSSTLQNDNQDRTVSEKREIRVYPGKLTKRVSKIIDQVDSGSGDVLAGSCHQEETSNSDGAEYVCDYCSDRCKDKISLALHIGGHVWNKKLPAQSSPKKGPSRRSPSTKSGKDRGGGKPRVRGDGVGKLSGKGVPSEFAKSRAKKSRSGEGAGDGTLHPTANADGRDETEHRCTLCDKVYASKDGLRRHVKLHTRPKEFKCEVCGREFFWNCELRKHMDLHEGRKPYECSTCGKTFSLRHHLNNHVTTHTGVKPFKCDICDKRFSLKNNLKVHSITHTDLRPYKCDICGKGYNNSGNLKKHLVIHTNSRPYECKECGKRFNNGSTLACHRALHAGVRSHCCEFCGKAFVLRQHLRSHMVIHSDVKRFMCEVCGKEFKLMSSLKTHSILHSGLKPFTCDICGNSYNNKSNLKKHKIIHTGDKQHGCDYCGVKFYDKGNLKKHVSLHKGVGQFHCELCGKRFRRRSQLKSHATTTCDKVLATVNLMDLMNS
ncbi:zinc finger protein 16-like [Ischnura elegans]|uniref:zinc finger protein 16-like n=1 Tax=Ischnura elegans TaxID=197161 RepID=UPI001ED879A2|nr:zinc finger protein 16-like [Ischnura elegans]